MSNAHVAFLDSGLGGLPYLGETRRLVKEAEISYVADRAHYPYGERSAAELVELLDGVIARIRDRLSPDIIVLACNTASVTALDTLRRRHDIPFVGVVPAVKPAASASVRRSIGVLSTSGTARASYLADLIRRHANGCGVHMFPAASLIDYVEEEMPLVGPLPDHPEIRRVVELIRGSDIDQLVLGCTHFLHIKEKLIDQLGSDLRVVDSADGVARQVQRVRDSLSGCGAQKSSGRGITEASGQLWISAEGAWSERYAEAAAAYDLSFSGAL